MDQDTTLYSAAAIVIMIVLAACFVVLVGLVATLPAVTNRVRRVFHLRPAVPNGQSLIASVGRSKVETH